MDERAQVHGEVAWAVHGTCRCFRILANSMLVSVPR